MQEEVNCYHNEKQEIGDQLIKWGFCVQKKPFWVDTRSMIEILFFCKKNNPISIWLMDDHILLEKEGEYAHMRIYYKDFSVEYLLERIKEYIFPSIENTINQKEEDMINDTECTVNVPDGLQPANLDFDSKYLDNIYDSYAIIKELLDKEIKIGIIADGTVLAQEHNANVIKKLKKLGKIEDILIDKLHDFWKDK